MKHLLLAALLAAGTSPVLAQKIKVDNDLITVDGQPYARIEQEGCGIMDADCFYYVKSLQNQRLFVVKQKDMYDPAVANASNPQGRVMYLQYVLTGSKATAETAYPTTLHLRALDVARKVYKAQLIKDGTLDAQAADEFVTNNGNSYSERRKEVSPAVILVPGH